MFPTIKKVVNHDDWIFVQDSAPSHRSNFVQDFLEKTLKRCFVKCVEWPPSLPDLNYLFIYLFRLFILLVQDVQTKLYQGRAGEPFSSEEELKRKIKAVWKGCATDMKLPRKAIKQFVPRLRAVEEKQGYCIKMISD